jgi:CubicO group peptidase (beta-lactamase class C family)
MSKMIKHILIFYFIMCGVVSKSQSTYFPPLSGQQWDTVSPAVLNWCQPRIDSLYDFLDAHHTKGFIVLKGGKIVLEKYFGSYTIDSIHYWASAGKSLAAALTGIAQEKGFININNPVYQYNGSGWSNAPSAKENLITVKHLLSMTSGLNDSPPSPCTNEDSSKSCLTYLADAGMRWAYHTGAYLQVHKIISNATGQNFNLFTTTNLGAQIGLNGLWVNGVYYSKTRDMARFGLLALNNFIWNNDTIIHDGVYKNDMKATSQNFNLAYGYLWWLNGQSSFMLPGLQFVFPGTLLSNGPTDMYAALGKNDQKIYIVPSQNLVVIRTGDAAYSSQLSITVFDNEMWGYIDSLSIGCPTGIPPIDSQKVFVRPNPATNELTIHLPLNASAAKCEVISSTGITLLEKRLLNADKIDVRNFAPGIYFLRLTTETGTFIHKFSKE